VYILNAPRYHLQQSCYTSRPFSRTQSRCSSDHRRQEARFPQRKDQSYGGYVPRARVLPRVQSHRSRYGSRSHQDPISSVTTVLFLALSPGLLLTLPPGSGGVLKSGQTSISAAVTHAVVFAVVFALLRKQFPQFY